MTFCPSNERGRSRTDYHAGRILIPHLPTTITQLGVIKINVTVSHIYITLTAQLMPMSYTSVWYN